MSWVNRYFFFPSGVNLLQFVHLNPYRPASHSRLRHGFLQHSILLATMVLSSLPDGWSHPVITVIAAITG